jgi:hypothetical protein
MKISHLSVVMILVVAIAVACAGCSTQSTSTTAGNFGQQTPAAGSATNVQSTSSGSPASSAGSPVTGSQLFGGLNYNWIEYKISGGSSGQQFTMYIKWTKEGKCTMRFDSAQKVAGMPSEMDCSSTAATGSGGQAQQSNPNDVKPDVKFVRVGTETVTVPAGTFVADKYTASVGGTTATYWIVNGKPLIKTEGGASGGASTSMELNGWG